MAKNKVLIVDDEVNLLKILKLNLESTNNYEVKTLSNAKDIISEVHSFAPDIILLDMIMPKIGGVEVCNMLNKDPLGQVIPIVILSALSKDQDQRKAFQEGAVLFLQKPIETKSLVAAIEKILRRKRETF